MTYLYPKYNPETYCNRDLFAIVCKTKDLRPVWAHVNCGKWGVEYTPFLELCPTHCPLCESKLNYGIGKNNVGKTDSTTPSTDHKLPRNAGGTNDIANLWVICERCNRMKNNAIPEDAARLRNIARFLEESKLNTT